MSRTSSARAECPPRSPRRRTRVTFSSTSLVAMKCITVANPASRATCLIDRRDRPQRRLDGVALARGDARLHERLAFELSRASHRARDRRVRAAVERRRAIVDLNAPTPKLATGKSALFPLPEGPATTIAIGRAVTSRRWSSIPWPCLPATGRSRSHPKHRPNLRARAACVIPRERRQRAHPSERSNDPIETRRRDLPATPSLPCSSRGPVGASRARAPAAARAHRDPRPPRRCLRGGSRR